MNLSVVIPTQNRKFLLEKFLPQSLNQDKTKFHYEVIVVDYMSTDGTSEYILEQKKVFPNLRGLRIDGNSGFNLSKTRNIGIEAANGNVIFTLDADVEVRNENSFEYWHNQLLNKDDYCILRTVGGGNLFFKRKLWELTGGYPNFFKNHGYEDWVFMSRAKKFGGYLYVPDDFNSARKHNNKWFGTVKPIRNFTTRFVEKVKQPKGYIDVQSNWEDPSQDTVGLWNSYSQNPEKYKDEDYKNPTPPYKEIE